MARGYPAARAADPLIPKKERANVSRQGELGATERVNVSRQGELGAKGINRR